MVKEAIPIPWRETLLTNGFRIVAKLRLFRLFRFRLFSSTYPFSDYFKGFEKVEAVRRIFGETTEDVLCNLRVELVPFAGYMGVDDSKGHLLVNPRYLKNGNTVDLYLDVIHELVHIRQRMDGKALFDTQYSYAQRPTEVEAYRYVVEEARRLGLRDKRICEYLKVPWMSREEWRKLASTLHVNCE